MAVPAGINGGLNDPEAHNTGSYNSILHLGLWPV